MNMRGLNIRSLREGRPSTTSRAERDLRKLRSVRILKSKNVPTYYAELTFQNDNITTTKEYTAQKFIKIFGAYYDFLSAESKILFDALKLNSNSPPVTPTTSPKHAPAQSPTARRSVSHYSSSNTVFNSRTSALSQASNSGRLLLGQEDGNLRVKKSG